MTSCIPLSSNRSYVATNQNSRTIRHVVENLSASRRMPIFFSLVSLTQKSLFTSYREHFPLWKSRFVSNSRTQKNSPKPSENFLRFDCNGRHSISHEKPVVQNITEVGFRKASKSLILGHSNYIRIRIQILPLQCS